MKQRLREVISVAPWTCLDLSGGSSIDSKCIFNGKDKRISFLTKIGKKIGELGVKWMIEGLRNNRTLTKLELGGEEKKINEIMTKGVE